MKIKRIALSLISCFALLLSSIPSTAVFVSAIDGKAQELTLMTSEDFQESTTGDILFANGISITVKADPDNPNQNIVTCDEDQSTMTVSTSIHIFAGSHNTDALKGPVKITVDGAKIGSVWGGGMHKSHVGNVEIVVKRGSTIGYIQGGGSASNSAITRCTEDCNDAFYKGSADSSPCVVDNATITVEDGATVNDIYGGGEGISNTKNTTVNIKGGDIEFVGAGGSNGRTGTANVNIEGGNIGLVQSVNRGSMDSAKFNVSGGTIEKLYIGGETEDQKVNGTITSSTVNVTGGTVKSLAPGTSGGNQVVGIGENYKLEMSKEADVTLSEDFTKANITVDCEHNLKQVAFAKDATCTEKGSTDGWQCQNCNKYFKDADGQQEVTDVSDFEKALAEHKYKVQKIEKCPNTPDNQGDGYTYYICETCGGYFGDENGTKIGNGDLDQVLTELQSQATANGHTPAVLAAKTATCSQTGLTKGLKCSACGETFVKQELIERDSTNHVDANGEEAWGKAELNPTDDDKAAEYPGLDADGNFDCTKGGWTRQVCKECAAHKYAYVAPEEAHSWGEPEVVGPDDHDADCTNPGQGTKKCTNQYCTATETDEIAAKGHQFEIKPQVEADCETDGNKLHWECKNCDVWSWDANGSSVIDDHADVVIAKYEHRDNPEDPDSPKYGIEIPGKEPTCTESGYSSYKQCKWCGEIDPANPKNTLPVNEYGHAYSSLAGEAVEVTCETDGKYAYFQCENCNQYVIIKPEAVTAANPKGYVVVESGEAPTAEQLKIPAKGHQFPLTQVSERGDATCTEGGAIDGWQCEACKKYFKDADAETEVDSLDDFKVEATGHTWVKVEASCTREAYYKCEVCGQLAKILETSGDEDETLSGNVYLQYIDSVTDVYQAGHHTWNSAETKDYKAPTCEAAGNYGSVTCEICNMTYKTTDDKGNPIDSEENYIEISNADELVIAALGHDYGELIDEVPATCTDEGTLAHYKCSVCNKLFKNDDDKTETDADGLVIPANGHQYGDLIAEDKNRNVCTEPGMKDHYQCSECGKYFTDKNPQSEIEEGQLVIPAKGHQSETYVQAKDATCTTPGSTVGTRCSVCGVVLIAPTVIPALGHDFKEENYKTKTPATCEEKEIQEAKCSRCDVTQTREKPDSEPLGHDYQKVEAKEATCTEPGNIEHYKCSRCTKLFVDEEGGTKKEIPAEEVVTTKEHNYGELIAEVPATCTEEGTKAHYQCSECEKLFVDETTAQDDGTSVTIKKEVTAEELVIEKIAHTVVVDEAVEATCTKIGYTEGSHCSVCNTVIKEQIVIPMKLHTPVTDEAVEATCTKTGLTEGKHCSVCGGTIVVQTVIPALGHDYKNGVCTRDGAKDPNYTAPTQQPTNTQPTSATPSTTVAPKIQVLKITQAKVTNLKVKSKAKKNINVSWKKVKGAKGYEIEVSKNSKFKVKAKVLKKTTNKLKLTIKNKKIKSKKTYYVRVRAYTTYKDTNGITKKAYSNWNYVLRKVKVK